MIPSTSFAWRWEIEVGFRDQKTLLGSGQAQVRTAAGVERVPTLIAAAYGFMHLAMTDTRMAGLPRPLWQKPRPDQRCTTQQAINVVRMQLWGRALGVRNFGDFVRRERALAKSSKKTNDPVSAVLYAAWPHLRGAAIYSRAHCSHLARHGSGCH